MILKSDITGLVLSGGRATRMGGVDKGLQLFGGLPLAHRAAQRLGAQTGAVAINANRHLDDYRAFGFPVWPDAQSHCSALGQGRDINLPVDTWRGPLDGMRAGMELCRTGWLATVPCDSPLFPSDLVSRLAHAAHAQGADAAMAAVQVEVPSSKCPGADAKMQPVFSLFRVNLLESMTRYLDSGGRRVGEWMSAQNCAVVGFEDGHAFANVNTLDELVALDALQGDGRD